jgi:hypothetical protein
MSFSNPLFDKYTAIYTVDKSKKHDRVTIRHIEQDVYEAVIIIAGVQQSSTRRLPALKLYLSEQLMTISDAISGKESSLESLKSRLKLRKGTDILFGKTYETTNFTTTC